MSVNSEHSRFLDLQTARFLEEWMSESKDRQTREDVGSHIPEGLPVDVRGGETTPVDVFSSVRTVA